MMLNKRFMNKKMIVLALLALLAGKVFAFDFSAVSPSGQTLFYNKIGAVPGTVAVTFPAYSDGDFYFGYQKPTGHLVIPSIVNDGEQNYVVTVVAMSAFTNCSNLTSVVLPDSLTVIDHSAFSGCGHLEGQFIIPETVTQVESDAFIDVVVDTLKLVALNCPKVDEWYPATSCLYFGEKVISIPDYFFQGERDFYGSLLFSEGLETIGKAFCNCKNMTGTLNFPSTLKRVDGAFDDCSSLSGDLIFPDGMEYISGFGGCAFNHVVVPSTVTAFTNFLHATANRLDYSARESEFYAFDCGEVKVFHIGKEVEKLVLPDMWSTSVITMSFDAEYCMDFSAYPIWTTCSEHQIDTLIIGNGVKRIPDYAFCEIDIKELVIPSSVEYIGRKAFFGCHQLQSLIIPNSVTYLGKEAFQNCSALTSLVVGNGVPEIMTECFSECSELTNVSIGKNVTAIAPNAFYSARRIKSITVLADEPPTLPLGTFEVSYATPVYVACGTSSLYQSSETWMFYSDYHEMPGYFVSVVSSDNQLGYASVVRMPDCNDDMAVVKAVPRSPMVHFDGWFHGDGLVSQEQEFEFHCDKDMILTARFSEGSSVSDDQLLNFSVFPNPTCGAFSVEGEKIVLVNVFDCYGRKVVTSTQNYCDLSDFPDGLYVIRVVDEEGRIGRQKVLKVK